MIDLIIKTGYEDDGVDGFTCLNCKSHISIRISWSNGIDYCPYCGTKFSGAWIYVKRPREIKHALNMHPSKVYAYWELQTAEINYHSDGSPFIDCEWTDTYITTFRNNRTKADLLKAQKETIEKFLSKKHGTPWGSKTEFKTRLVYIKEYPNRSYSDNYGYNRYGKKEIVAIKKETLNTLYPKKKSKVFDFDED